MKTFLIIFGITFLVLIMLFIFCVLKTSSICSREEEKYEEEIKKNKMGMD